MDASKKFLFTVLVCACFVVSTSLPFPDSRAISSEAYINCNDLSLLEKLKAAGIPFICLQNSDEKVLNSLPVDPASNELSPSTRKNPAPVTEDKVNTPVSECPDGYTFVPEKDDCILSEVSTQESKSEIDFRPKVESLASRKCQEGYVFNSEREECLPDTEILSVNFKHMIPKNADEEIITTLKCQSGTVYAPQVDLCLPIKPEAYAQPPELESVEIAFIPHPTKGCPKGSVYSPEIDHCLKIQGPSKVIPPREEVDSVIISSQTPSRIIDATSSKRHDYEDANKEVRDAPSENSKQERSASDPTQLSLHPLTHELVGREMCKPEEVYVSEIDLCLKP